MFVPLPNDSLRQGASSSRLRVWQRNLPRPCLIHGRHRPRIWVQKSFSVLADPARAITMVRRVRSVPADTRHAEVLLWMLRDADQAVRPRALRGVDTATVAHGAGMSADFHERLDTAVSLKRVWVRVASRSCGLTHSTYRSCAHQALPPVLSTPSKLGSQRLVDCLLCECASTGPSRTVLIELCVSLVIVAASRWCVLHRS